MSMLQTLKATNYEMFDGDKEDALDFIGDQFDAFTNYANIVIRESVMTPIWRDRYEGQDLRDKIQDIDRSRKIAHDSAISGINILNRLSNNMGLPPFAEIDTKDRHQVANFVGQYINEVYNKGIGNTFDDATYNKTQEYDATKTAKRLQQMESRLGDIVTSSNQEQEMQL